MDISNFMFQGRMEEMMKTIPKVDPVMHQSMLALENIIEQEEARQEELAQEIADGIRQAYEGYEFDEDEFKACIPRVLEYLKNNGEIPSHVTNIFDRSKYADDWYVFCNALVTRIISCDVSAEDRADPAKAMEALGRIVIDEDLVEKYLRPHSMTLLRFDSKSPYKDINENLSLPVLVLTEGLMTYRMSVATTLPDVWWYNILDQAHGRWEMILNTAMDMVEGSGVDLDEAG